MRRTLELLLFLLARRGRNWFRRMLTTPGRLIPFLLLVPTVGVILLSAVAVFLIPSYDVAWERGPMRFLGQYEGELHSAVLGLLVLIALGIVSKALEGDLLAFQQSDVDFLFPAPVSRRAMLLVRLTSEYLAHAALAVPLTLYLVLPLRISIPSRANPAWAGEMAFGVLALVVLLTNLGRLAQALIASRVEGLRWARAARGIALAWALVLVGCLAIGQLRTGESAAIPVRALSSRLAHSVFAPCAVLADLYVSPLQTEPPSLSGLLWLALAAVASGVLLLVACRPACESALPATARRHALWQAIWKADATSIRAAELMGRNVRGSGLGLPPFGRGAGALVSKSLLYGWRNSPWGVVVAGLLALSPLALGPSILRALDDSALGSRDALGYAPIAALVLVFAWSQRIRLTAREEFSRLTYLRSLPLKPTSVIGSMLVIPTTTFSLFLAVATLSGTIAFPTVDTKEAWLVAAITPPLFAALGSIHLCSALLYPTYDPSIAKGFLSDLVLLPIAGLVFSTVVGAGTIAYYVGAGPIVAVIVADALAVGWLIGGIRVAGALLHRMDPGS